MYTMKLSGFVCCLRYYYIICMAMLTLSLSLSLSLSLCSTLERRSKRLICQDGWTPPPFDPNCVRLVLYWDHEGRGKVQIFDTKVHLSTSNTDTDNTHVSICLQI